MRLNINMMMLYLYQIILVSSFFRNIIDNRQLIFKLLAKSGKVRQEGVDTEYSMNERSKQSENRRIYLKHSTKIEFYVS